MAAVAVTEATDLDALYAQLAQLGTALLLVQRELADLRADLAPVISLFHQMRQLPSVQKQLRKAGG